MPVDPMRARYPANDTVAGLSTTDHVSSQPRTVVYSAADDDDDGKDGARATQREASCHGTTVPLQHIQVVSDGPGNA
jgi:hypothetical protein